MSSIPAAPAPPVERAQTARRASRCRCLLVGFKADRGLPSFLRWPCPLVGLSRKGSRLPHKPVGSGGSSQD